MHRALSTVRNALGVLAVMAALGGALAACGDDPTPLGLRCGDNICFGEETAETCPRDCSYECVAGATRCEGNVVATCAEDGLHETLASCEAGEVCREGVCE